MISIHEHPDSTDEARKLFNATTAVLDILILDCDGPFHTLIEALCPLSGRLMGPVPTCIQKVE